LPATYYRAIAIGASLKFYINMLFANKTKADHTEHHYIRRSGWLRAAVLGANDGIVSTASLLVGVSAAGMTGSAMVMLGVAALVAGAMSMAAGEYVSVSSQADMEKAELERERFELKNNEAIERQELAQIYVDRGLDRDLASQVAEQLMAHDALEAHARDELGLSSNFTARPLQAALSSAASFAVGAGLPLLIVATVPSGPFISWIIALVSLLCLIALGALSATIGGSDIRLAIFRISFWGMLAMGLTAIVGRWFAL